MAEERALARNAALVPTGPAPAERAVADAEARLRALVGEVTALDAALEALSAGLADFGRRWERAVGAAFAELAAADRLVRRLQALEDGLLALADAIARGEPPAPAPRGGKRRKGARAAARAARTDADADAGAEGAGTWPPPGSGPAAAEEPAEAAPELDASEGALKRLYRRLARVLHPDLAQGAAEQARLGDLMARVNAAYAAGDRTALELVAERVGAGEPPGDLSDADRLAHLERRVATLERIGASLARERGRLERTDTHRLRAEAERRAAEGRDLADETRAELAEELAAARADAAARLDRAAAAARALARERRRHVKELERRGPTGARRVFDPLAESDLVRRSAARLDHARATAGARELARHLEDQARAAPWEVALTALAFLAEEAGGRPPDTLETAAGWTERWDRLRAAWAGAPALTAALAALPRHLVVGARASGGEVLAGLQLASEDLLAGVRIALQRPAVAALAAEVLAALGPDVDCAGCGARGPARHLHRTRGLDTLHGLVCAACGRVVRSYWRYGEVDGLEALAPHALGLGLVAEVTAALGGTALGFQLLPAEAEALTAGQLRRRFAELYLAPYQIELPVEAVRVEGQGGALGDAARVAGRAPLRLEVEAGAGTTAEGLLELLRSRIERRFRP